MQELETLVHALERGEMPLEQSFQAFEKAIALQKTLQNMLDDGDRRIRMLTQNGETDFFTEENE